MRLRQDFRRALTEVDLYNRCGTTLLYQLACVMPRTRIRIGKDLIGPSRSPERVAIVRVFCAVAVLVPQLERPRVSASTAPSGNRAASTHSPYPDGSVGPFRGRPP
jgi:hypothetical protein